MCEFCEQSRQKLEHANAHIASLLDAVSIGANSDYEISGPYLVGGTAGAYTCKSPFLYDSQWRVDSAVNGASVSSILVSSFSISAASVPDVTGAGSTFSGVGLEAYMLQMPANGSATTQSEWYNLVNSENSLNVIVSNAANAAFVNIVFRQKRNTRRGQRA